MQTRIGRSCAQPIEVSDECPSHLPNIKKFSPAERAARFSQSARTRSSQELLRISEEIDPAKFEVTAILANLEQKGINPMVLFERPVNQLGKVSPFPLVTNIYSSRTRCALALGMQAQPEPNRTQPRILPPRTAADSAGPHRGGHGPVKQVVKIGDEVDLRELPIVRHHHMDPAPYIDMAPIMRDPRDGPLQHRFPAHDVQGAA